MKEESATILFGGGSNCTLKTVTVASSVLYVKHLEMKKSVKDLVFTLVSLI